VSEQGASLIGCAGHASRGPAVVRSAEVVRTGEMEAPVHPGLGWRQGRLWVIEHGRMSVTPYVSAEGSALPACMRITWQW
jgi:hypothetical protein